MTTIIEIKNQAQILVNLHHAAICKNKTCEITECQTFKELWAHIITCHNKSCTYKDCKLGTASINHHRTCEESFCLVCLPVNHRRLKYRHHLI